MSFVFLILIRRGQAIAEILDFSWTGAIPLWCESLSDFGGRVLGCLGEVLRRFCDPPPPRIVGVRIGSKHGFQIGALPSFLKAELLETPPRGNFPL
jgi:hypothetical protein